MSDAFEAFGVETTEKEITLVQAVDSMMALAPPTVAPPAHPPDRKDAAPFTLQQLAKKHTEDALNTIVNIMNSAEEDGSTRLEAAKVLLDRGWGKPTVQIKQETIKYTISDLTKALEKQQPQVTAQMEEAMRLENDGLARYITVDAEVVEDSAGNSRAALQDS
ncbi:MAG: hypothetical protein K2X27_18310 [Candidatus Obscuribacterales bacterium]|nr:hypothetical protein [Candidatus Obscuribacterales bacterium]